MNVEIRFWYITVTTIYDYITSKDWENWENEKIFFIRFFIRLLDLSDFAIRIWEKIRHLKVYHKKYKYIWEKILIFILKILNLEIIMIQFNQDTWKKVNILIFCVQCKKQTKYWNL